MSSWQTADYMKKTPRPRGELNHFLLVLGNPKSFSTFEIRSTAKSISAVVVFADKLNRIALEISSISRFMARKTFDGSLEPLVQAEPVEQTIPAKSKAKTKACRSRPGNDILHVCGTRGADP